MKVNRTTKKINSLQKLFIPIYILIFLVSITCSIVAEDTITPKEEKKISTKRDITADSLKWEYEERVAVFSGDVTMKAQEGEITASKMTVFFDDEDEIEKMVGEGTATLTREKQKGGGEIIEVYPSQDLLILKNGAWISSDKALFKGEEIHFDTEKEIINITQGVSGEIQTSNTEE